MGATIHVLWTVLLAAVVCVILVIFGKRPTSLQRPLITFVLAFVIGVSGFAATVAGSREGTQSSKHFYMYFVGSWLLLTFIRSRKWAACLTTGLVVYVFCHRLEYMMLSASDSYTDNPKHRSKMIQELNTARKKRGLPEVKSVKIQPGWHTWLTDVYDVNPPAGGSRDFAELYDRE